MTSAPIRRPLERARMALQRACETLDQEMPLELATTDLRDALVPWGDHRDTVSDAIPRGDL